VELYIHSPIRLHGVLLNWLSTGTTLSCISFWWRPLLHVIDLVICIDNGLYGLMVYDLPEVANSYTCYSYITVNLINYTTETSSETSLDGPPESISHLHKFLKLDLNIMFSHPLTLSPSHNFSTKVIYATIVSCTIGLVHVRPIPALTER
jgi:hypothetical protein